MGKKTQTCYWLEKTRNRQASSTSLPAKDTKMVHLLSIFHAPHSSSMILFKPHSNSTTNPHSTDEKNRGLGARPRSHSLSPPVCAPIPRPPPPPNRLSNPHTRLNLRGGGSFSLTELQAAWMLTLALRTQGRKGCFCPLPVAFSAGPVPLDTHQGAVRGTQLKSADAFGPRTFRFHPSVLRDKARGRHRTFQAKGHPRPTSHDENGNSPRCLGPRSRRQ